MSAVLLIVIPLLVAFLSILSKKVAPYLLLLVSFGLLVLLLLDFMPLEVITIGGFVAPYGIELVFDQYAEFALIVVNSLFFVVIAINYKKYSKLASILLVALAGLNGLLLTGDLFNLFVFLEVTAITAYLIASTNKSPVHTFHYVVAGTVGSSLYLLGLILLYNMFGTLNMSDMASQVSNVSSVAVAFPFLLMFIGLGVEAKLLPFNSWAKGVLGTSNTLSGPLLAGVYAGATLFVFGRLLMTVFVMSDQLMLIVSIVLGASILAGEAMAYASTKTREILLFSSVAQAGIAILVFVSGYAAFALLFVALNAVSKVVLFLVFNTITAQIGSDEVTDMKGLFATNKLIGVGTTIVILSLLGLPLFVGFAVKVGLLQSLFESGQHLFVALILVSTLIEGVYFVKLLITLWYQESDSKTVRFNPTLIFVTIVVAIGLIVYGVYFEPFTDFINTYMSMIGEVI